MNKEYFQTILSGLNLAYEFTLMEESELTLNVLNKVIDLTRYFSQSKEDMVMLGQEIEQIEKFLSILELRFQKNFQYKIYLKEELKYLFIKRFYFIEHIVKLFINHIESEPNKKMIKIYITNERNGLNMRIENENTSLCEMYIY